jgi:hypothetical protein
MNILTKPDASQSSSNSRLISLAIRQIFDLAMVAEVKGHAHPRGQPALLAQRLQHPQRVAVAVHVHQAGQPVARAMPEPALHLQAVGDQVRPVGGGTGSSPVAIPAVIRCAPDSARTGALASNSRSSPWPARPRP